MPASSPLNPAPVASHLDDAVARMMWGPVGSDELDLSIGEPDQPMPDALVETGVTSLRDGNTGYTPKLGLPVLRELIAEDVAATGVRPDPADVLVTIGGTGAVAVALLVTTPVGETVVVPDPAWPNYRVLAEQLGIVVTTTPQGLSGAAFFDLDGIETALHAGARTVVVNSPSNPTAAVADLSALRSLAEVVRAHDAWILSDEAYESVLVAGGRAPSPYAVAPERTLVARTFSKTFSMTGMRVGALVVPPALRIAAAAVHGTTAGCAPITAQLIAIEALRSHGGRGAELSAIYGRRFRAAVDRVGRWMPSTDVDGFGGFYLWLDTRDSGRTGSEVASALRALGIVVSTGAVYSATDDFIRVALTADDTALEGALDRIAAVLAGR